LSLPCGEQSGQNALHSEVLENHHQKSPQRWMELRLYGDYDGKGRPIWVVAAERSDAGRFIVNSDQELPAFLELESAIKIHRHNHECDCPERDEELGSNR
jgi:hypothetical protein